MAVDESPDDASEDEEVDNGRSHRNLPRNRPSIYQKLVAIREMDRLVESGMRSGVEKAVMATYPHLFQGAKGPKTGMLGRWKTQCDMQRWREIPFERLPEKDRNWRELPDWVRIPLGLGPRSLERFKEGKNVPQCIVSKLVEMVERLTTGSESGQLTSGTLDMKMLKKEAESLLDVYKKTQAATAAELGLEPPEPKTKISDRWLSRLLDVYGWRSRTPNTYGAYLDYDDSRMEKSRKMLQFQRATQGVRLDMTLNFDQLWKASWSQPKKLWHKVMDTNCAALHLSRTRDKIQNELFHLQQARGETSWEVKKRRVTGEGHLCLDLTFYLFVIWHLSTLLGVPLSWWAELVVPYIYIYVRQRKTI